MNVAIIGIGYWGVNIIRSLSRIENINIKYLCDINISNIEKYKELYNITSNYEDILIDNDIKIVFIVTPISTHYNLICECINRKKNVYVEKPICKTIKEFENIMRKSKTQNVKVFCDYTFNHSDKINNLKSLIGNPSDIIFIEINRDTHRVFNGDSIIYDLLPHDLTIIYKLFSTYDINILCSNKIIYDDLIIKSTVEFKIENTKGVINTAFLTEQKNRKIKIICKDKILLYDDTCDIVDILYYVLDKNDSQVSQKVIEQKKIIGINYNEPLLNSINAFLKILKEDDIICYTNHIELSQNIVKKIQEIDNL